MEFVRGISNLKSHHRGCVLTIGNFDGFHRGHQKLIKKLKYVGNNLNLPVMVMIFEPHPKEYFFSEFTRLVLFRDKFKYLFFSEIDILLCVFFNLSFSLLDPYVFISELLVKKLGVRVLYVGDNFRFGAFRRGNFDFLKKMSTQFGFEVMNIDTYTDDYGQRISSTAIRRALLEDRLVKAKILLGHSYSISGRVSRGTQLGTLIGFPTLNILLKGKKLPINGVYAVKIYTVFGNNIVIFGIANIGVCPTIHNFSKQRLEVHMLDCTMNLYGYHIEVEICGKIRDERYFSSLKELRFQILNDIRNAKKFFCIT